MNRISKITYLSINIALVLLGSYCLYFVSHFWIGSQEQHQEVLATSGSSYFFGKFFINLIFIAVVIGIIAIVNRILKNINGGKLPVKRILLFDLLLLIIASSITIFLSMK